MSKKVIYNKHLEKGRFYSVHNHPGLIVAKSDKKNQYLAVITGSSFHRHQTMLKHSTEKRIKRSYVNNRPVLGKRKHFGSRELAGMRIHRDDRSLIRVIKKRKPIVLK